MNLRVWQNPWRLMLAVNAAVYERFGSISQVVSSRLA